jgi:hypothetical protein
MMPAGGHFSERNQDKSPPGEFRMRQQELSFGTLATGTAYDPSAKIQDVEIERPWLPVPVLAPPCFTFKSFQQLQELRRTNGFSDANNHVQVSRLTTNSKRSGAIKRRVCENVKTGISEFGQCPA